jgi:peptide/nickel transport system permease protein
MSSTAQTAPAAGQVQPRKKARINRWDSPWLNPKFLIGLGMVLSIMLMGPIGRIVWQERLSYPASSPLNLPPPWAPGIDQTGLKVVTQTESVSSARPTPAPAAQPTSASAEAGEAGGAEAPAGRSVTGGNPFARPTAAAAAGAVPTAAAGAQSMTGGNPLAQPTAAASATSGGSGSMTGGNPLARPTAAVASQAGATSERKLAGAAAYARFGTPTWEHPLGTESSGRDMLAVLLVGAPRSLRIGLIAATIGMLIGVILGFTAGYMGGWVDAVIRTLSDAIIVIPVLAVLIVIGAYVKVLQIENMALLLAAFLWPAPTRYVRAQVLSMRERGYVNMARISGASSFDIMFKEMMPNMLPYIAASYTGNVSAAILAATSLEVLGLGPTRIPTLGMTIYYAISAAAILRGMWWWWGIPIAALVIVFSGLFLMTIGLDEIANPRLRGRRKAAAA